MYIPRRRTLKADTLGCPKKEVIIHRHNFIIENLVQQLIDCFLWDLKITTTFNVFKAHYLNDDQMKGFIDYIFALYLYWEKKIIFCIEIFHLFNFFEQ